MNEHAVFPASLLSLIHYVLVCISLGECLDGDYLTVNLRHCCSVNLH